MRCKVQLYVAGTVFDEIVIARDYEEARKVALARNPNAKVLGVTAVFCAGAPVASGPNIPAITLYLSLILLVVLHLLRRLKVRIHYRQHL